MAAKVFFPGDNDAATGVLLATTGPSCGLSATTQSSSSLGFLTEHSKSKNSAQEDEINPPNNDNDPNKFDRSTKIITFRYEPRLGDEVLGIVRKKGPADSFKIDLGNGLSAKLQNSAFNGATLRNKPDISVGDFVFAKVSFVDKDLGIEISCVEDANVQTWSSGACFYQMLDREDGEMVEKFSAGRNAPERVRRTVKRLGKLFACEFAFGRNDRCYVRCSHPEHTVAALELLENLELLTDAQVEVKLRSLQKQFGKCKR